MVCMHVLKYVYFSTRLIKKRQQHLALEFTTLIIIIIMPDYSNSSSAGPSRGTVVAGTS